MPSAQIKFAQSFRDVPTWEMVSDAKIRAIVAGVGGLLIFGIGMAASATGVGLPLGVPIATIGSGFVGWGLVEAWKANDVASEIKGYIKAKGIRKYAEDVVYQQILNEKINEIADLVITGLQNDGVEFGGIFSRKASADDIRKMVRKELVREISTKNHKGNSIGVLSNTRHINIAKWSVSDTADSIKAALDIGRNGTIEKKSLKDKREGIRRNFNSSPSLIPNLSKKEAAEQEMKVALTYKYSEAVDVFIAQLEDGGVKFSSKNAKNDFANFITRHAIAGMLEVYQEGRQIDVERFDPIKIISKVKETWNISKGQSAEKWITPAKASEIKEIVKNSQRLFVVAQGSQPVGNSAVVSRPSEENKDKERIERKNSFSGKIRSESQSSSSGASKEKEKSRT